MHYQHLTNFITSRIRKNDIFVPAMILFLVKNDGWGTKEQIARLLYIFEYKHELAHYETIVDKFASVMLEDYSIVKKEDDIYKLRTWPLNNEEIKDISSQCLKVANGFFTNIQTDYEPEKKAS
ncbi:MAG TPA: hypothetical protein EYH01_07270 [Campylobacterales bacterium]|nr:hypothetical protein [Campylobacterales bacterium]HIP60208.1 hypothetical protein [Campylobacterales bacterium]